MKNKYILTFFFILSISHIQAAVEDHFKPARDKSDFYLNQVRNIDYIYLLNLDQRPEKLAHCLNELEPYGIHPYRFSAVNGWELTLDILNDVGIEYESYMVKDLWATAYLPNRNFRPYHEIMHSVGRNYFSHCLSRGAVGIALSHLSILQDALNSGYETIWVIEDDILVIQNPHSLSDRISELDHLVGHNNWDILFTDQDTKNQKGQYVPCFSHARRPNFSPEFPQRFADRKNLNDTFRKIGARYGAYSMIIRRSGMQKILDFIKTHKIFFPYDMDFYLPNNITLYALINDVVSTQPNALSDNGKPYYNSKK